MTDAEFVKIVETGIMCGLFLEVCFYLMSMPRRAVKQVLPGVGALD